ncbi:hypothetical protein OIU84_029812 [Salix udensis]|uniref:Uncharacterized protein n=1 Tax=Salix udensis TaxID=889485 RepID=A0AAD6KA34_9ROSI|nr:hypothetical protein OIU84_029812 [Salix udensis]
MKPFHIFVYTVKLLVTILQLASNLHPLLPYTSSQANVFARLGHQRDPATVDPLQANLTAVAGPSPPQIESELISDRVPAPGSSD